MWRVFFGEGGHAERRFEEFPFPNIKINVLSAGVSSERCSFKRVNNHLKKRKKRTSERCMFFTNAGCNTPSVFTRGASPLLL